MGHAIRTECQRCGAKTWGALEKPDQWTERYYVGCVSCGWGEYGPAKSQETRLPDRQCDKCGIFVPQWDGFPVETVCCHCLRDPNWQRNIDCTKPLFLCV